MKRMLPVLLLLTGFAYGFLPSHLETEPIAESVPLEVESETDEKTSAVDQATAMPEAEREEPASPRAESEAAPMQSGTAEGGEGENSKPEAKVFKPILFPYANFVPERPGVMSATETVPGIIGRSTGGGEGALSQPPSVWLFPEGSAEPTRKEWRLLGITLKPSLLLSTVYQHEKKNLEESDSWSEILSLGLRASIGDRPQGRFAELLYAGSVTLSSDDQGLSYDQSLVLFSQYAFEKFVLGTHITFDALSGHDRDLGGSSDRDLVNLRFSAGFELTRKTGLTVGLEVPIRNYSGSISSRGYTVSSFVNYGYSKKTVLGLGAAFGTLNVDDDGDQTFFEPLIRMEYSLTRKLHFLLIGGADFRRFESGEEGVHPVFTLGARYDATDGSILEVQGSRKIVNSAVLNGENFVATTLTATYSRRLARRLTIGLNLGVEHASYERVGSQGNSGDREDLYFYATPRLEWYLVNGTTVTLSYSYGRNTSNRSEFSFENQYIGLSVGYVF